MKELWIIEREHADYEGGLYWSTYDTASSYGQALTLLNRVRVLFPTEHYRLVRLRETRMVIGI